MPPAARADTPWSIGAAKVDTTPPAFDAAQDIQDFPEIDTARGITCPRDVYNGPRLWRFEEPYQDTDGSGDLTTRAAQPSRSATTTTTAAGKASTSRVES